MTIGLVFKDGSDVIFGEYNDDGEIDVFRAISDDQGIYSNFPLTKFSVVEVSTNKMDDGMEVLTMKDLFSLELARHEKVVEVAKQPKQMIFDFAFELHPYILEEIEEIEEL